MINTQTLWFRFPRAAFARETGQRISRIAWMCVRMTKSECLMLKESVSRQSAIKHQTSNSKQRSRAAFTLIELLVVIGLMLLLMVFAIPAFTNIKTAGDVTGAAYTVKGVLDSARTYAMSNNTYAWVGFYEENTTATAPTNATPAYPGKGRFVLAIVASKDGTTSCQDPNSTSSNRIPLTASLITQIGKLVKFENIHMTDIGAPPSPTPNPTPEASSLNARSAIPYSSPSAALSYLNRINSDDTHSPDNATLYPFVAEGYTFYKTVRFSPSGEA